MFSRTTKSHGHRSEIGQQNIEPVVIHSALYNGPKYETNISSLIYTHRQSPDDITLSKLGSTKLAEHQSDAKLSIPGVRAKGNLVRCSLIISRERVVCRAKVRPCLWHEVRERGVDSVLGKHDGEARLEMEVDVAMEEPRAWVVGLEADCDVVARGRGAGRDDVAPDRVVVVVFCGAGAADHGEGVLSGKRW